MTDFWKPTKSVLLKNTGKTDDKIELFPAQLWEDKGGSVGDWRLKIGGCWHQVDGIKYSFLNNASAQSVVEHRILDFLGTDNEDVRPDLPPGTHVRFTPLDDPNGMGMTTYTMARPFQGKDGLWRVWLCGFREQTLTFSGFVQ